MNQVRRGLPQSIGNQGNDKATQAMDRGSTQDNGDVG